MKVAPPLSTGSGGAYFQGSETISNIIGPILLIIVALVQATLSPYMSVSGVHPDLILLMVISWTILRGLEEGATWALVGGVSLDLLSGAPFGVFSLNMLLAAIITSFFHGRIFGSSIVVPMALIFPLGLLFNSLSLLMLNLLGYPVAWGSAFFFILLPVAIFNTGMMIIVFPLLYLLNRWLNPQPITF